MRDDNDYAGMSKEDLRTHLTATSKQLAAWQCDEGQGYFMSRPLDAARRIRPGRGSLHHDDLRRIGRSHKT